LARDHHELANGFEANGAHRIGKKRGEDRRAGLWRNRLRSSGRSPAHEGIGVARGLRDARGLRRICRRRQE